MSEIGREGKAKRRQAVSQSCQAPLMSSRGEWRQTQPTLHVPSHTHTPLAPIGYECNGPHRLKEGGNMQGCGVHLRSLVTAEIHASFWLTSVAFTVCVCVCVLAPVRLASASLLAVSQRFTPLFYLPGCARDFY